MSAFQVNGSPRAYIASSLRERTSTVLPTHVGNTCLRGTAPAPHPVHPHACGEHPITTNSPTVKVGSSPRMWGTPQDLHPVPLGQRFIPTHVGNTSPGAARFRILAVHPHACGEHFLILFSCLSGVGSSPRMWGTRTQRKKQEAQRRFIPTHVGNTLAMNPLMLLLAVHPHACGEHAGLDGSPSDVNGSSPRMWGTPRACICSPFQGRFIPTHVGNTLVGMTYAASEPVHPHACGEHSRPIKPKLIVAGSSPRMWGTPLRRGPDSHSGRFIPTHVGNTLTVQNCF